MAKRWYLTTSRNPRWAQAFPGTSSLGRHNPSFTSSSGNHSKLSSICIFSVCFYNGRRQYKWTWACFIQIVLLCYWIVSMGLLSSRSIWLGLELKISIFAFNLPAFPVLILLFHVDICINKFDIHISCATEVARPLLSNLFFPCDDLSMRKINLDQHFLKRKREEFPLQHYWESKGHSNLIHF